MSSKSEQVCRFVTFAISLSLFSYSQAKRTICVRQPSKTGVTLIDGMEAGFLKNVGEAESIVGCLNLACNRQTGNIAFLWRKTCYMVTCKQKNRCGLLSDASKKTKGALYRILFAYPEFESTNEVLSLSEDVLSSRMFIPVKTLKATAESRERDKERMTFEIVKGNIHDTFLLNPKVSNWGTNIFLTKRLDRESVSHYVLQLRAVNSVENVSSDLNVSINVLDVNDNRPSFVQTPIVFSVLCNITVGSVIGQMAAIDNDTGPHSKLEYYIKNPNELITYAKDTGEVYLKKKLQLDSITSYEFSINVTDGTYTTEGRLRIDVHPINMNRPTLEKTSIVVRLNGQVPSNTTVAELLAYDPDYGKLGELTYVITNGNDDDIFMVDKKGFIRTKKEITSKANVFNLTISVHDKGEPKLFAVRPANVVILVQWLRFNEVVFNITVEENFGLRETLYVVTASLWIGGHKVVDSRQTKCEINYHLLTEKKQFQIDKTRGVVTLNKSLDYKIKTFHIVTIEADCKCNDSTLAPSALSAKAILNVSVVDIRRIGVKKREGFRTKLSDIIVIVLGVVVGIIILLVVLRALFLYRRAKLRLKWDKEKQNVSTSLSHPSSQRSAERTPHSSRSTISFTDLSTPKRLVLKLEKMEPRGDAERIRDAEREGMSHDSGCGGSARSSYSDVHLRGKNTARKAFISCEKTAKTDDEERNVIDENGSEEEMATELNTELY